MHHSVMKCTLRPPTVSALRLDLEGVSNQEDGGQFSLDLGPPVTVDHEVNFNKAKMETGRGYTFFYKNKDYLAIKTAENTIEIYRVKK